MKTPSMFVKTPRMFLVFESITAIKISIVTCPSFLRSHAVPVNVIKSIAYSANSPTQNMGLFKKDVTAVNGFNHDFTGWGREDSEFVIRLFRYGLKRKENPFKAICYHLWHPENSRNNLGKNDIILEKAIASKVYFCDSGLNQLISNGKSNIDVSNNNEID